MRCSIPTAYGHAGQEHGRAIPLPDISGAASADHLVSANEKASRHHEVERLRGLEVERELDNCGPLDRDIGGLCTPQQLDQLRGNNLVHQRRDAGAISGEVRMIRIAMLRRARLYLGFAIVGSIIAGYAYSLALIWKTW